MKQFSILYPEIVKIPHDIDKTLKWTNRSISSSFLHIPASALIDDKLYMLTDFESGSEFCLLLKVDSLEEALNISISAYHCDSVSLEEWINLYKIMSGLHLSLYDFNTPKFFRNEKDFIRILHKFSSFPIKLIKYISDKSVPWKYIRLMTDFTNNNIMLIVDYIEKVLPSSQQIRQFIHILTDFASKITDVISYECNYFEELTDRRTELHYRLDKLKSDLGDTISPIAIFNKDNYETTDFHITFTASSYSDFVKAVNKLNQSLSKVEKVYQMLGAE